MAAILFILLFLVTAFLCFTGPGIFLLNLSRLEINRWEKFILGTVIGYTLFTLLTYILLLFNLPLYLAFAFIILNYFNMPLWRTLIAKPKVQFSDKFYQLILVLVLGIIGQLAIIAPSGRFASGNMVFYSALGHDGVWHIALIEELQKGFPIHNPIFAGERLVNYHFFSDLASAVLSSTTLFSAFDLHFRYFPWLLSLLFGGLAFLLGRQLGKTFYAGLWAMILTYFAGSFGYIVTWLQNRSVGGESIFWSSQVQSSSGNPPQLTSFVLVLTFFYLFNLYLLKKNRILYVFCILLAGSLVVYKVYAGAILLAALGIVGLIELIKDKKPQLLGMFIGSGLLSAALYLPNTANTGSFLIWEPWWFIRTMVVAPDRLNWLDMELRRQTYISEGNWKRVFQLEATAFLIFLIGNLGVRFIGFWTYIKLLKSNMNNYTTQLFVLSTFISILLPLLYLQKGVAGNTSQFIQIFLLFFGIAAGVSVAAILDKIHIKPLKVLLASLIIILAIPTQLSLIYSFYNRPPFAKIDNSEITALEFLKKETTADAVILTAPFIKYPTTESTPMIWNWSDTAYVSALSSRRTYLADTEQSIIMGYDIKERQEILAKLFKETDPLIFNQLINQTPVNYLYFPKILRPQVDLGKTTLTPAYQSDRVEIWKVN